jgi:hypothetical protein
MNLTTRYAKAFLVAVILGCLFGWIATVSAQEEDPGWQPVYYPGICLVLTPHSGPWIFFDCDRWMAAGLMMETVVVTEAEGERVTQIERVRDNGDVERLHLSQRIKK